jgi:hypothetical protein
MLIVLLCDVVHVCVCVCVCVCHCVYMCGFVTTSSRCDDGAGTACYNVTLNTTTALNMPMAALFNTTEALAHTCLMTLVFSVTTNSYVGGGCLLFSTEL